MPAIIEIDHLHYHPPSLAPDAPDILYDICLRIDGGAFIAIIGENGSGKTSLIKHINGLILPTKGLVRVDGIDTQDIEKRQRLHALVGMVFQNPADQIVSSTVEEDVAFGLENANLPFDIIRERVTEQLAASELTSEAQRPPHLLSGGQIQRLALAGVLARHPKVILFDEPTSMLDPLSRKNFLDRIYALHNQGMTVIYVTHHMEETIHADQIVVLKDGRVARQGPPSEIFLNGNNLHEIGLEKPETVKLAEMFREFGWDIPPHNLTTADLMASLPEYKWEISNDFRNQAEAGHDPLVEIDNVHYSYLAGSPLEKKALTGVNLTIEKGNVHSLAGTNGSGKSTLLQHINGILRPARGHVKVADLVVEDLETPLKEIIKKVGLVFQNPETQFFEVFVGDEIAYGPKQFGMPDVKDRVRQVMSQLGLDFEAFKDRRLETLSGGEKRKVALASTLVLDQDLLLFDEPTAGMDPRARDDLLRLFQGLHEKGKSIVIASHRLDELAVVSKSISIMVGGKIDASGATWDILTDIDQMTEAGMEPPLSVLVGKSLMDKGWPLQRQDIITSNNLIQAISEVMK